MGEDALIDAHIVVDSRITVSEGHTIGDIVRDEVISRFDDVMDVLVHIDPEDDEAFFEKHKPLTRNEVKLILDKYLPDFKSHIEDFRIHYLSECVEVELILPFSLSADALLMTTLKKQIRVMKKRVRNISNVVLFFKQNEE